MANPAAMGKKAARRLRISLVLVSGAALAGCAGVPVTPPPAAEGGRPAWVDRGSGFEREGDRYYFTGVGAVALREGKEAPARVASERARREVMVVLDIFFAPEMAPGTIVPSVLNNTRSRWEVFPGDDGMVPREGVVNAGSWYDPATRTSWARARLDLSVLEMNIRRSLKMRDDAKSFLLNHIASEPPEYARAWAAYRASGGK